jgi:serine/threonine-protein kinase RsbW
MNFIESCLTDDGIDKNHKTAILTACEEVIVNIINYAYPQEAGNLEVDYNSEPGQIILTFIDGGQAFNPLKGPEVDITLPIEEREIGGLGILMVKNLMDDVRYEYKEKKNYLTIAKNI